jgi:hypothetical protein
MSDAEEKVFTIPELRLIILSYAWEPKKKKKKCKCNVKVEMIKCLFGCVGFNMTYMGRL